MPATRLLMALLTGLVAALPVGAGEVVTVELPEQATATAAVVRVGDVARVTGGDPAIRERVAQLDLAECPPRNQSFTVTRRLVEFRIRLAGVAPESVRLTGADTVVVSMARQGVTAEQVVNAARATLLRHLPWPAEELSIDLVQPIAVRLPEVAVGEEVTVTAKPHSSSAGLGRVQMDVAIAVQGQPRLALPVFFEVKLVQPVVVCRRSITAGEVLSEANSFTERRPVDPARRFLAVEQVRGRKATRPLAAGQIVATGDVESGSEGEMLVRLRQRVTMVVRLGAVNVSAAGEALQEGRLGQIVRVQNIDSKKIITGRVSGPGTVEIDLGGAP